MQREANRSLARSFIQRIFNDGELSLMADFVALDAANHELQDALGGMATPGLSAAWMTELVSLYRCAFPDLRLEITDQIADGDRVVTCVRMRGIQEGPLMGIEASQRAIDVAGIRIDRFAGGKIVESWFHLDSLKLLQQLGALPDLQRSPAAVPRSMKLPAPAPARLPLVEATSGAAAQAA